MSSDSSVSAIDQHNEEQDKGKSGAQRNWPGFFKSCIHNLIIVMVFGLIGTNYIFMANCKYLDMIFPSDINEYGKGNMGDGGPNSLPAGYQSFETKRGGKSKKRQRGGALGSGSYYDCSLSCGPDKKKDIGSPMDFIKSLGYGEQLEGRPYSWYEDNVPDNFWNGSNYANWFAKSEANAWIWYRQFMKGVFTLGTGVSKRLPDPLNMFIGNFFCLLAKPVVLIMSCLTSIASLFSTRGGIWHILYGFFAIIFGIPGIFMVLGNMIFMFLSAMFNFYMAPPILDTQVWKTIFKCNLPWLSFFYAFLVCGSASAFLDNVTAGVMMAAWVGFAIKACFFK